MWTWARGPRIRIAHTLPGDAEAAGLGTTRLFLSAGTLGPLRRGAELRTDQ